MEPANDASAVCVSAGVCASDDADDLHCQGEKQGSGEAQLHAFKAPVILAEEGDEAQDGNGHLNNADVIGEIRDRSGVADLQTGSNMTQANESYDGGSNVINPFPL